MFKKTIDFLLYSNIFISACAVGLLWASELLTFGQVAVGPYTGLVFGASLFVYAAHRVVSVQRLQGFGLDDRHQFILRIQPFVIGFGAIGLIMAVFFFFGLDATQQALLIIPGLISLSYIIPFSSDGRRLRDYPFVKIFLIAFTWSWVTTVVPLWMLGVNKVWLLFFERFFFIFAITLPFDIRDLVVDKIQKTRTIPQLLGIPKTKRLAFLFLGISMAFGIIYLMGFSYRYEVLNGYFVAGYWTFLLINRVEEGRSDYFFTGWLDGTMIMQFLFYFLSVKIFS